MQWPPEHSFVAFALSSAVKSQCPSGQLFLQSPVQSHDALLIAPQVTPTVGRAAEPLEELDDEELVTLPLEDVVLLPEELDELEEVVFPDGGS